MSIKTKKTPNPNALKFILGTDVSPNKSVFIDSLDLAKKESLLAVKLYDIDNIESIFLGADFVTVTKNNQVSWSLIKPKVLTIIATYLSLSLPILNGSSAVFNSSNTKRLSKIERKIIEIIDTRVRPLVVEDGGDIVYKGFKKGVVYLELHGACRGCPSSSITLKEGIQSMIQYYVPEVKAIEQFKSK